MGIEDAEKALGLAFEELMEYCRTHELVRLRDACEKGWLAVILATDELLMRMSFKRPESYSERRRFLEELERKSLDARELGLRDRFGARGFYLRIQGFHEGALSDYEVERELVKVRGYINDAKALIEKLKR